MTSETDHVRDEIQDLLDGRLEADTRKRVEAHLAGCEECDRARQALSRVRESVRAGIRPAEMPTDLPSVVVADLDREDARGSRGWLQRPRGRLIAAAAAAVVALIALTVFLARPRDLPAVVGRDYTEFRAGRLPLEIATNDPRALEKFFANRGVRFRTRVLDLAMMGYQLVGGSVLDEGPRRRAFFVYRGEGGKVLACQMYEGDIGELSGAPEVREHGDFTFLVYRSGDLTQVFWQEGTVTCVLVSDIPSEEVVQLAFAKAMKA
jgi:anti-sigma factor RsiW